MKYLLCAAAALITLSSSAYAHGGGCLKAYRPQCCHTNHSTGEFHCH